MQCFPLDVAVLVDTSRSMSPTQRLSVISIIKGEAGRIPISPAGSHYALATFDFNVKVRHSFADPPYQNKTAFLKDLEDIAIPFPNHWGTRADLAANLAATSLFTPEGGDRPYAKNYLFIFTDGKQLITKKDGKPLIPFSQSTKALEVSQCSAYIVLESQSPLIRLSDIGCDCIAQ